MVVPEKFRFRQLDSIGAADAFDDTENLDNCFVDTGHVEILEDIRDPRRIVLGRTGAGKSALLLELAKRQEVISLEIDRMIFCHIANNRILTYLASIGVHLDVFFKLLWRHVLTIELLKRHPQYSSNPKSWIEALKNKNRSPQQKKAREYLETWEHTFWVETDERVKEITKKLVAELTAEFGGSLELLSGSVSGSTQLTQEVKNDILYRADNIINGKQAKALVEAFDFLKAVFSESNKNYYLTIDRIDELQVDEGIRYKLLKALLETCKEFSKIPHVKIVIAIRLDLLERILNNTRSDGFQQEKFNSLYLPIAWNLRQLTDLLNKRLNYLIKRQYTSASIEWDDVMPKKIESTPTPEYLISRTLNRPRDLIEFMNSALKQADGKPKLAAQHILGGEREYSNGRLDSLQDEWHRDYPALKQYVSILKSRPEHFRISEIDDDACLQLAASIGNSDFPDSLSQLARDLFNNQVTVEDFRAELFLRLYKVGAIMVKTEPTQPFNASEYGTRLLNPSDITSNCIIAIHPMLFRALGISSRRQ